MYLSWNASSCFVSSPCTSLVKCHQWWNQHHTTTPRTHCDLQNMNTVTFSSPSFLSHKKQRIHFLFLLPVITKPLYFFIPTLCSPGFWFLFCPVYAVCCPPDHYLFFVTEFVQQFEFFCQFWNKALVTCTSVNPCYLTNPLSNVSQQNEMWTG